MEKLQLKIFGKGTVSDGVWEVINSSNTFLDGVEKEYYVGDEISLTALGNSETKFLFWKRMGKNKDQDKNTEEMIFVMDEQHIIEIYFAPKYYLESKVVFDDSNYTNKYDIDNSIEFKRGYPRNK